MEGYILGLVGAAAVVGIVESLVPPNAKTKRYVQLVTALCMVCLIVKPLASVASVLPDFFTEAIGEVTGDEQAARGEYEAILEGEITETVRNELVAAIGARLTERFRVTRCEVGVSLERVDGELRVGQVVVTLMGKDIFKDPYAIEDYLSDLLGCECIVVVG